MSRIWCCWWQRAALAPPLLLLLGSFLLLTHTTSWSPLPGPLLAAAERIDPQNVFYLETEYGRVVIRAYADHAPRHVARLKELSRIGFYDGQIWHRVVKNFVCQTGDPLGKGYGGTRILLKAEFGSKSHNTGAVNMARVAGKVDSADSQFSIMYRHNKFLDGEYTVWGQVLGGYHHLFELPIGEPPENPAKLVALRVVGDYDPECVDHHDLCVWWAMPGELGKSKDQYGECHNNEEWMKQHCPLSCGHCNVRKDLIDPPCIDAYLKCSEWGESGECTNNPLFMSSFCCKTCRGGSAAQQQTTQTPEEDRQGQQHQTQDDGNDHQRDVGTRNDDDDDDDDDDGADRGLSTANNGGAEGHKSTTTRDTSAPVDRDDDDDDDDSVNEAEGSGGDDKERQEALLARISMEKRQHDRQHQEAQHQHQQMDF